ncbi:MAG: integrase core domain-containing protein [Chloroflexota bacterium]
MTAKFSFPVQAIQSDKEGEFHKECGPSVEELQLIHYSHRPDYAQSLPRACRRGSGCIERSFRTDEEESYQVEGLPADLDELEAALLHWDPVYETVWPHQALGYKTPDQFYHDWFTTHPTREEALSDMS